jgi:hypothetical protein
MRIFVVVITLLAGGCNSETPAAEMDKAQEKRKSIDVRQAEAEAALAKKRAEEAVRAAEEAAESVQRLEKDLADLDTKVGAAVDAVVAAQSDADRAAAKAKLEMLRKEKAEFERRTAEAKAAAARARRVQGSSISKECQDNPLAKGCS